MDTQAEPRKVQQLRAGEAGQGGGRGQLHSHGEAETSQGPNIYTKAYNTLFRYFYLSFNINLTLQLNSKRNKLLIDRDKCEETKTFMTNLMETKMNFKVYLDSVFSAIEMDQSAEFPTVDDIVKRFQALFESR